MVRSIDTDLLHSRAKARVCVHTRSAVHWVSYPPSWASIEPAAPPPQPPSLCTFNPRPSSQADAAVAASVVVAVAAAAASVLRLLLRRRAWRAEALEAAAAQVLLPGGRRRVKVLGSRVAVRGGGGVAVGLGRLLGRRRRG